MWSSLLQAVGNVFAWFWSQSTAPRADTDAVAERWKNYGSATSDLMNHVTGEFDRTYQRIDRLQDEIRQIEQAERECQKERRDAEARHQAEARERAHRLTQLEIDHERLKAELAEHERQMKRRAKPKNHDEPNDL